MQFGFFAGKLDKNFSKDNKITLMSLIAILTLVSEIITIFISMVMAGQHIEILSFIKIILVEILYNVILTIILYPLILRFGQKLENDFINNNSFLRFL